ncbi:hypothetical protein AAFF_G00094210 [Aldrovandia affinis]|uniref:Uncharacterized protein n=1 Tax=Aldrovandia affinis TaxID=143900 RepID=A0AAD7T3A6_9TELE|nr:hypothetical protein AAFF_G00094210 [Aldrovandia affinis]
MCARRWGAQREYMHLNGTRSVFSTCCHFPRTSSELVSCGAIVHVGMGKEGWVKRREVALAPPRFSICWPLGWNRIPFRWNTEECVGPGIGLSVLPIDQPPSPRPTGFPSAPRSQNPQASKDHV